MSTYSITPNSNSVNEGDLVIWTIITTGISNGTLLYWENVGTTTSADFTSGTNTGSFTVNNNFAILKINIAEDFTSEGGIETIIINLYTGAVGATLVATAPVVNVIDTSTEKTYTIIPSATSVIEGSAITWTITTTNVSTNTPLFWVNTGNTSINDFVEATKSGVIYVNNLGIATLTLNLVNDLTLEGTENIIILLKTTSIVGFTVATSLPVYIIDSSIGSTNNLNNQIETVVVNDKLILSTNKAKNIITVGSKFFIYSEIKRFDKPKKEGTNQVMLFTTTKIKNHTVPQFNLNIKSEKIYDVDGLVNPRFSPNKINISSKYYINSLKNYSLADFKNFLDYNNCTSLLKIESTANQAFDVRDHYNSDRRWSVPINTTTGVAWGPIKVVVQSSSFRYLDLSGGSFSVQKINNKDTQIYEQPTALQAITIPGGGNPAVEIKKSNTRFYLWKPRFQSLSDVLLSKSLFIGTNSDIGTRGGSNVNSNKGKLISTTVVHLDRVTNDNELEIVTATTTVWDRNNSIKKYIPTSVANKLNTIEYSGVTLDKSTTKPIVGYVSDWQTLIVTSESEGSEIEGVCWTQNLLETNPVYILNGINTKFLKDLKVGDKILNKNFVGYGFDQRFTANNSPDNGPPGDGLAQVRIISKVLSDTYAEVSSPWAPADSTTTTVPAAPYKVFKNLTKQSRGITKYYINGILTATSNLTYQSWLIDKIGAMNSDTKSKTTAHAAPGFLAQAGLMDKTLSPLEVYELHIRLKYFQDSTIDTSSYLINPFISNEKYMETVILGSDNPENIVESNTTAHLLIDGPLYVITGNPNSGFINNQSWRKLIPTGSMSYGKQTYSYGDELVYWDQYYWVYTNTSTQKIFAVSYDNVTWPWEANWTNDFSSAKVIPTYTKTNNYIPRFINPADPQQFKQILTLNKRLIASEKFRNKIGPGELENNSIMIFSSSKENLKFNKLLDLRSEKIISFEQKTNESWTYL